MGRAVLPPGWNREEAGMPDTGKRHGSAYAVPMITLSVSLAAYPGCWEQGNRGARAAEWWLSGLSGLGQEACMQPAHLGSRVC